MNTAARLAALVGLVALAAFAEDGAVRDARADAELLLESGMRVARRALEKEGGVQPFAFVMAEDGRVTRLSPAPRRALPAAGALLEELQASLRARASEGALRAVAIFSDVVISLSGGEQRDAIHAAWEHRSGACADVYVTYQRGEGGALQLGDRIEKPRKTASVFQRCAGGSAARSDATSRR